MQQRLPSVLPANADLHFEFGPELAVGAVVNFPIRGEGERGTVSGTNITNSPTLRFVE